MIDKLSLQFGSSESQPHLFFSPGPMTVFVGPNNAGKSLILREIEESLTMKQGSFEGLIIKPLIFKKLSGEDAMIILAPFAPDGNKAQLVKPNHATPMLIELPGFIKTLERLSHQDDVG